MNKFIQRFLKFLECCGVGIAGTLIAGTLIAVKHLIDTPQPLENTLPGEPHLHRWKYGHVFYKQSGESDRPAIVLLHDIGIGSSSHEMRHIAGKLAQEYQVYIPDLPGFGLSDRPHMNYTPELYTEFYQDFLTAVVKRPTTLLASGLSANYAVITAQRHPELCERLIFISPTEIFQPEQHTQPAQLLLQWPGLSYLFYALLSTRAVLRYALAQQKVQSEQPISGDEINYLYATTHQFGAQHAPLARLRGRLNVDVSQQFGTLPQPTLLLWGAQTLNNTHTLLGKFEVSPRVQMVLIQDAYLHVHEQYPEMVVANIREWSTEKQHPEGVAIISPNELDAAITADTPAALTANAISAVQEQEASQITSASVEESEEYNNQVQADATQELEEKDSPASSQEEGEGDAITHQPQATHDESSSSEETSIEAYCVRCKKKTVMQNPEQVTMKNGNPAVKGTCSICGAGQYRMGRLQKDE